MSTIEKAVAAAPRDPAVRLVEFRLRGEIGGDADRLAAAAAALGAALGEQVRADERGARENLQFSLANTLSPDALKRITRKTTDAIRKNGCAVPGAFGENVQGAQDALQTIATRLAQALDAMDDARWADASAHFDSAAVAAESPALGLCNRVGAGVLCQLFRDREAAAAMIAGDLRAAKAALDFASQNLDDLGPARAAAADEIRALTNLLEGIKGSPLDRSDRRWTAGQNPTPLPGAMSVGQMMNDMAVFKMTMEAIRTTP